MQDRESYNSLVKKALANGVRELMPWDLEELLETDAEPLLLDIREPGEFNAMHIPGSLNVPRGVLEAACDYDFDETEPDLVKAREREIIVICRSGNRSVLAAETLSGADAHRVGFVHRIGTPAEALDWAGRIAELAPLTIAGHKLMLDKLEEPPATDSDVAAARNRAWSSEDLAEGLDAFRNRRTPTFHGR